MTTAGFMSCYLESEGEETFLISLYVAFDQSLELLSRCHEPYPLFIDTSRARQLWMPFRHTRILAPKLTYGNDYTLTGRQL